MAYELSEREKVVLYHVAEGLSDQQIGMKLKISHWTVNKHLSNILTKMEVQSRTAAAVKAVMDGIIMTKVKPDEALRYLGYIEACAAKESEHKLPKTTGEMTPDELAIFECSAEAWGRILAIQDWAQDAVAALRDSNAALAQAGLREAAQTILANIDGPVSETARSFVVVAVEHIEALRAALGDEQAKGER